MAALLVIVSAMSHQQPPLPGQTTSHDDSGHSESSLNSLLGLSVTGTKGIIRNTSYFVCVISQTKSSLDKIFYKIVYHHIIYMCDFFHEFR